MVRSIKTQNIIYRHKQCQNGIIKRPHPDVGVHSTGENADFLPVKKVIKSPAQR